MPVLACADALTARGARVETVIARSDAEIDEVLARLDAPARPDGLTWPDPDSKTRLVVATASDAQLRAVLRRLVRRYAPPPSRRPAELAGNRTVPDLPPIGVLPLDPARGGPHRDLAAQLGLPRDPAAVAAAVLDGSVRRLDLLRNDGGSVTLDGALLGAADDAGRPLHWRAGWRSTTRCSPTARTRSLACAIGNAGGYATLDDAAAAHRTGPGRRPGRGRGGRSGARPARRWAGRRSPPTRYVGPGAGRWPCSPATGRCPFLDDGVEGELSRKRSWWTEPGAWAVWSI